MDPINTVRQRIDFAMKLYDREALQPREGMRRFLESEAWIAFPGPALADVVAQLASLIDGFDEIAHLSGFRNARHHRAEKQLIELFHFAVDYAAGSRR